MIVQILDAEPNRLAGARARDCQQIGQQPEFVVGTIGGGDEFADLGVGKDYVAGFLRIRQGGEANPPRVPFLYPFVMLRRLFQRRAQAGAQAIDGRRRYRAEQAVAPFLQFVAASTATGFASSALER